CRHLSPPVRVWPPIPPGSSGRSRRCSSCPRARLSASAGSSRVRRPKRSTPPSASIRAIAAARWRHVIQYVVGNGSPASSNGACWVTAGRPNGQRTATRRNARGVLPSCCSTIARSSSTVHDRSLATVDPGRDALDDVELLAGAHEAQAASLLGQGLARARLRQPMLQLALLGAQRLHVGRARREVVLGLD